MPARILSRVDLPVPLPPTRPVRSSGVMSQLASSKSSFGPNRLPAAESWSIDFYFLIGRGKGRETSHDRLESANSRKPVASCHLLRQTLRRDASMPITPLSYILAAILLLGLPLHSHAQVQRALFTDGGDETHDTPQPHPLTWWTHNPLRLDASGNLMIGKDADNGHTITTRDYRVQQRVTTLGTVSNHRIVQVLTTIHAGPRVILWGYSTADSPPSQWKSLLVETHKGYYEELYALQIDMGDAQIGSAGIYGSGPNSILATYDTAGGNGG